MATKTVARTWTFQSSSGNGEYETRLYTDGSTSCNCPGWARRVASNGSRSCKHTKQVEAGDPVPTRPISTPSPSTPASFPGVMLAEKYDAADVRSWPAVWCEPKLDGMRILLVRRGGVVQAFARSGKCDPYTENLRHILAQLPKNRDDYAIDGELFADEGWGRTMTLAKRSDVSEAERRALKVRAFDCLDLNVVDRTHCMGQDMATRRAALEKLATSCSSIVPVPYRVFRPGDTAIDSFYRECLDAGYEGLILKHPEAAYTPGQRSPRWMKMKPVDTGDGVIVGFDPGEGKHEGRLGAIRIRFNGTVVAVGGGYTDRQREWVWEHQTDLIGGVLEFAYQKDSVAVARFPRFARFRWDRKRDRMLATTFPG